MSKELDERLKQIRDEEAERLRRLNEYRPAPLISLVNTTGGPAINVGMGLCINPASGEIGFGFGF